MKILLQIILVVASGMVAVSQPSTELIILALITAFFGGWALCYSTGKLLGRIN